MPIVKIWKRQSEKLRPLIYRHVMRMQKQIAPHAIIKTAVIKMVYVGMQTELHAFMISNSHAEMNCSVTKQI